MEKRLHDVLRRFSDRVALAGILKSVVKPNAERTTHYSDVDLCGVMRGGTPTEYLNTALDMCTELLTELPTILLFGSFKQQIVLTQCVTAAEVTPCHFLLYMSPRHLAVRELNTLPRFIPDAIQTSYPPQEDIIEEIRMSYRSRGLFLHPSALRLYYYFDIANETIPLFANSATGLLPQSLIVKESLHKLRFVARYLGLELTASHVEASVAASAHDALLETLGFGSLVGFRRAIADIEQCSPDSIGTNDLRDLFLEAYRVFDDLEGLVDHAR